MPSPDPLHPAPPATALRTLARAEAELSLGIQEETSPAGKALLRSLLAEYRAKREALLNLSDDFLIASVGVVLR